MNYIAEKNGKKFRVSGGQVAAFRNAGYTVTEETATAKKATKRKAKATETADTGE